MALEYLLFQLLEEKGIGCVLDTYSEGGTNYFYIALFKDKKLSASALYGRENLCELHEFIWDTVNNIEEAEDVS